MTAVTGSTAFVPPTRLTSADLATIEARVQEIGRRLLARALAAQPGMASTEWWAQQAGEWATHDDELKVRLFRLVDCMPMLEDPAALDRHVREYLDDDVVARLPHPLRAALQAARSGLLAPFAARAVRAATLAQARRFIAGTTPDEAAAAALTQRRKHRAFTLDLLGEAVISDAEADAYAAAYARLLAELPPLAARWAAAGLVDDGPGGAPLPRVNVSLKLSALDGRFDAIDPVGTTERVLARLRPLWRAARDQGGQVHVDMESHATKDLTLAIFKRIALEEEFRDWPHCGIVIQCYLRDALRDLADLAAWAERRGTPVWIRLVKGAYWDHETIHARAAGWPVPVWERKWETDHCYETATTFVMEHARFLKPALGSHNLRSLAHGMAVAEHLGLDRREVEMQMLYGMADPEKDAVTAEGWRLRVYMPYGQLVPGMAYLVRRLLENSSNDSFLRAGFVQHVPAATLLAPPGPAAEPGGTVAVAEEPAADAAGFHNEPLTDFALEPARRGMQEAVDRARARFDDGPPEVVPVVIGGVRETRGERFPRHDPADHGRLVAQISAATPGDVERAVETCRRALPAWHGSGWGGRAAVLRNAAVILRRRRFELAALQVFEVGKPWREADADVAEAIDFCLYYAAEAERLGRPRAVEVPGEENATGFLPRGVTAVIAPWNFPLAILAGMTTAALVTGNTVVMKPAEQSSLTALRLHEILLAAGVPPGALALVPGRGEQVGPPLVAHPDVATIVFTGSRAVGLAINAQAAAASAAAGGRLVKRVIAELGGKNAIIVDDDADLDEAVAAVVRSAFGFQGQKCSACSRAIVLASVHDAFTARLAGAIRSLAVGPAADPGTQVGPLVDREAFERVRSFIDLGRRTARPLAAVDVGPRADRGWFVGPHAFENVDPAGPLGQEEIFGPVLAVIRARDFDHAIEIANGTAYALTAGICSRSPSRLERARRELAAGNVYLNRGITGAFVHRQPFGGYRMSGIGSKAGGPDYLLQFVTPRTVTENTVRRGFAPERKPGHRPGP